MKLGLGGVIAATLALDAARAQEEGESVAPPPEGEVAPSGSETSVDLSNFSFDALSAAMRNRAAQPYAPQGGDLPDVVANLDYDGYRRILFRRDQTVWRDEPGQFRLQPFFPGFLYQATTRLHVGDGQTFTPLTFTGDDFEFLGPLNPDDFRSIELPGVAGFRIQTPLNRPDRFDEITSFLGASYFRAVGRNNRYGLSARGLAINTATGASEEFPRFSAFYIVRPEPNAAELTFYAELDSPSLTGAYAFTMRPGSQTTFDVVKRLYFRQEVERLGVAPLTSMYFFGENDPHPRPDFRPEVHDSDGLFIERASGERVWRPLKNPDELALTYLSETSPRRFGLLQRDREFTSYQDIEARYEARPSLMIEPAGDWGRGVVQLVEIPTASEANDNVVAFWVPEERPQAGSAYEFRYRMHWGVLGEMDDEIAIVAGTFAGSGGNAAESGDTGLWRFEINFAGGPAASLPADAQIEPLVDLPGNAQAAHVGISRLPDGGWRLSLDLARLDSAPVELRARLGFHGRAVSETWIYQWTVQS